MDYTQYHIPCAHEQGQTASDKRVSDYHPLTVEQIEDLLRKAIAHKEAQDARSENSVLHRLVQGIQGIECPYRDDGPVADKQSLIYEKALACIKQRNQDITTLAKELHAIMQS
jgi:hypothetical protein